ncbi:ubiquitin carboxyl-terminal hydrolase 2-like isoform X2 [Oculina patagonica]
MSLAMHRSPYLASSSFQRSSTGAVKPSRTFASNSVGAGSSASSYGGSRMGKQANSSSSRALPNGPGPLPDRPVLLKSGAVKYVTESSRDRTSTTTTSTTLRHFNYKNSNVMDSPTTVRRKTSNDSGYGSSGGKDRTTLSNNRYGDLSKSKSKSMSHLYRDEADGVRTTSFRSRTDSSSHGVSSKTYTQNHIGSKTTVNGSNSTGIYRSTTHSDYRDPGKEDKNSVSKTGHSYSTEKDLTNGYTSTGKHSYSVIDADKTHKATITALPGADMRCSRKSSFSSSNSSPSNSPTGRSSSDGLVGLRNLGNTCFMNSILQCLSHTQPLTDQLLKGSHIKNINSSSSMKGRLIQAFADLIKSMWKPGCNEAVSPHTFKTQIQRFAPRFMGYNQQDAQEFLRFLVEGLHDDLNQVKSKPKYTLCEYDDSLSDHQNAEKSWKNYLSRDNSLMTDLFVGQLKSTLKCCNCGYASVTFDPFWDLSLPIPRSGRRSSGADDSDINIRDCMQSFTREEVLDGDERPTCDKCKLKRKSTKKFSIQRFPPVLVLHLKRFSGFSFRSKLQSNVEFPLSKLDLAEFAADTRGRSALYSLYAVSNHSGSTYGGHYTAYCKHPISNQWHCFNDSRVDSLPSSRVRGAQAYILFYEKVEPKSSL